MLEALPRTCWSGHRRDQPRAGGRSIRDSTEEIHRLGSSTTSQEDASLPRPSVPGRAARSRLLGENRSTGPAGVMGRSGRREQAGPLQGGRGLPDGDSRSATTASWAAAASCSLAPAVWSTPAWPTNQSPQEASAWVAENASITAVMHATKSSCRQAITGMQRSGAINETSASKTTKMQRFQTAAARPLPTAES